MKITTGAVSPAEALKFAAELEDVIEKVFNGELKPGRIPLEPIARLIQYTKQTASLPHCVLCDKPRDPNCSKCGQWAPRPGVTP